MRLVNLPTLTPFTPFFNISSINKDRYSGDFSFRLTKCSKSYRKKEKGKTFMIITSHIDFD